MQQAPDPGQDENILWSVESPTSSPLHRTDKGKSGFPEPQDMLRHAQFIGGFGYCAKGVRAFGQWRS
jgi:hypothetical protein